MARAKTQEVISDETTISIQQKEEKYTGPRVPILLPLREEDSVGLTVDRHEHVTISNERGSNTDYIERGKRVAAQRGQQRLRFVLRQAGKRRAQKTRERGRVVRLGQKRGQ